MTCEGFMFTYIAPLVFVLSVTMMKEAYDDFMRMKRDRELNNFEYPIMDPRSEIYQMTKSQDLRVGMIIKLTQN